MSKNAHHTPFYECLNKVKNENEYIANYICNNQHLLQWSIESLFWQDFKNDISRLIPVEITQLVLDIIGTDTSGYINGITTEIYELREKCELCEDMEFDSEPYNNKGCCCDNFSEVNNIWIITDNNFHELLKSNGAMVYETDSYDLYLQTTYSGNWFDEYLRKSWVQYTWLGVLNG